MGTAPQGQTRPHKDSTLCLGANNQGSAREEGWDLPKTSKERGSWTIQNPSFGLKKKSSKAKQKLQWTCVQGNDAGH